MQKAFYIVWAVLLSYLPWVRKRLSEVARNIVSSYKVPRLKRELIMAVGFSKSGKHTVLKKEEGLRIDTDDIHCRLNDLFTMLRQDDLVGTRAYWARQIFTRKVRRMILCSVLQSGIRVVNESCNLRASDRKWILSKAKGFAYRTVIVLVQCPEPILLRRLKEADRQKMGIGEPPIWEKLYREVQRPLFDFPHEYEVDELRFVYTK
jgi:tRNA uridine 5-carbamoylmethylation protein Kti12